jgi:hypothetical protein
VNSSIFMSTTYCSEVGILICLHTTAKPLPMMFIRTADTAAGTAVKGDAKCMVARTTPKDEFCIPTSIEIARRCDSPNPASMEAM